MKQESAGSIPIRYVKEFSGRHEHVIVSIATRSRMADTVKCSVRHESFLCKETFYLTPASVGKLGVFQELWD